VRQEYIEVYEAPWFGGDPTEEYSASVESAEDPTRSIVVLDGISALPIEAHSNEDDEQANPAILRFVVNGIEVQVSGGENLDTTMEIARSIIAGGSGNLTGADG